MTQGNARCRTVLLRGVIALAIAGWAVGLSGPGALAATAPATRVTSAIRKVNPGKHAMVPPPVFTRLAKPNALPHAVAPRANAPGVGPQLVRDPGFEQGSPNPDWAEFSSGNLAVIDGAKPHSGSYSADLCGYSSCNDYAEQTTSFTVPSGIVSASASFYTWMGTQEATTTCNDYLAAGLTDQALNASDGSALQLCTDWADGAWHLQTINETVFLQARVGSLVKIIAQGITDNNAAFTRGFVDDFTLSIITAPGTPTSMLVQPDNSAATINWLAPPDGGSPITSYTITPYTNNGATAGTPVIFNSASTTEVITGLLNGTAYTVTVAAANAWAPGPPSGQSARVVPDRSYENQAVSNQQYVLQNSDGVHWSDMDASYLSINLTPAADALAIVSGNVDLWTANAGYNQDIGIAVTGGSYPTSAGQPEAWKESGGFAGTFSPNAAFVQTVLPLKAGVSYTFKLQWKTNKAAPGTTIVAAAGPSGPPFSPTRMTIQMLPAGGTPLANASLVTAVSATQYRLSGSNGTTWTDLAPGVDPSLSFTVPDNGAILISGNADLWTAAAGLNQDLGISVAGGVYPTTAGQPEAWKESGGFAGTFSPNAAFVQARLPVVKGVTYDLRLQWKSNKPSASNQTILAAAGPAAPYSPTRLTALFTPTGAGLFDAASTQQYTLANSDGSSWADIDPTKLMLQITPTNNCVATLSANADLWTANAGVNQDIGIQVASTLGTFSPDRAGWKESGGFAGTFSPNAAFVQTLFPMSAGTTYTVKLQWKSNKPANGTTIVAGAGPGAPFSPTRLTAQLACPAAAKVALISAPQALTAGVTSIPMMVQLQDTYGNPVTAETAGQVVGLSTSSTGGSFADVNGAPITTVTIAPGSSSMTFKYRDTVAGSPTITVQAPPLASGSQVESVVAAATAQFAVAAPATATHGVAFTLTVTAEDQYGNLTRGYTGTVHFTSTDAIATLPSNYQFLAGDNGIHQFAVTFGTAGSQTVTATDTVTSQVTGTSTAIAVS